MANKRQSDEGDAAITNAASDEDLVVRVGQGDAQAFRRIVARHRPRVVGMAWRMTGSQADGEDVAQEAFARVWVHAAKWLPEAEGGTGKFSTWLYRVVMNLCIDRRRRPRGEALDAVPEMADPGESAEHGLARRQTAAAVAQAVAELPERQKQAIVLCVYEEVSNVEAARIMQLSVGAVESLLVRARRGLKERLAYLQVKSGDE